VTEDILNTIIKLEKYIKRENYIGYDPYDILMSPIFKLPILKSNRIIRFIIQQLGKKLPLNVRPIIGTKKGMNPVTLGLCVQAYTYLSYLFPKKNSYYFNEIDYCIDNLVKLKSLGYSGTCWGYNFDWEARYVTLPAFLPTVVATGIITNSLFENYRITGNNEALDLCINAVGFILKDLNRIYFGNNFCFSYSPLDRQVIFNATMKGARLLAQVYSITREQNLIREAKKTVQFVVENQNLDGSWRYSRGDSREWIDNFHTGYVLDCLDEYIKLSGDEDYCLNLKKGINFYVKNFITEEGIPKYYENSIYPVDSTAASQSILTLTRFGYGELAKKVFNWMVKNMMDKEGYFYYQKHRLYTNKISYMRWSNAWMFCSLSYLMYSLRKNDLV